MEPAPTFFYTVEVEWQRERRGNASASNLPTIPIGAPPEFGGTGQSWSPEQLVVAALNACYLLTFVAIAENSNIPLVSFACSAKGRLEKVSGGVQQITEITLQPNIVVAAAKDIDRVTRIVEKAKHNCFVSNSLKSTVRVEPQIFHRQTVTVPCPRVAVPDPQSEPEN
jgi:peroxiredoxin-like protein